MQNIVLVGFMGSGKSSVGRALSKSTGKILIDTDLLISHQENQSISEIFSHRGEDYFRQLEGDFINWAQKNLSNAVIAAGGGMPIFNDISRLGRVVYLKMDFDAILGRLNFEEKQKRPLLKDLQQAKALYEKREKIYQQMAHLVLDGGDSIDKIAEKIIERL